MILALFVTFGADNFVKGPVLLLTEGVYNLRLDGLLTLIAITDGNLGGGGADAFDPLTRANERKREEI